MVKISQKMILAVDIGNTSITFGVLRGPRILKVAALETKATSRALRSFVKKICARARRYGPIEGVLVCSVVPAALKRVKKCLQSETKLRPRIIGQDIRVPLINRYRNPRQVGQDRLVCAYAAQHLYGRPVIVIDLGTAITLDVVSARKEYLGGIIVPGIELSTNTLYQKAALLPKAKIQKPRALIGRDTEGSILSGIFHGYGAMIRGLIAQLKKQIRARPKVVVTGGYTGLMKKYIEKDLDVIDKDLALKGMALLFSQRKGA